MGKDLVVAGCAVGKGKRSPQEEPGAKKQQRTQTGGLDSRGLPDCGRFRMNLLLSNYLEKMARKGWRGGSAGKRPMLSKSGVLSSIPGVTQWKEKSKAVP